MSKVLNYFKDQEIGNHGSLNEQINVVRELFKKKKIFYIFSNLSRGLSGFFLEKGSQYKIKCFSIPHGL